MKGILLLLTRGAFLAWPALAQTQASSFFLLFFGTFLVYLCREHFTSTALTIP
jgi:hypothetical protein